jgi:hypothetical protein
MSHLTIETLARLIEESPESHETAHLDSCDECRSELEGMKADASALAALPEIEPPSTQWRAIEQRLVAEGLLRLPARHWTTRGWTPVRQLAAAIVIFVLGHYTASFVGGRASRDNAAPIATATDAAATGARTVSTLTAAPVTVSAAAAAVRETERAYLTALTRYTELAGGTNSADPVARLAALESIVLTTRAALGQAPADPVINGYHLTALAQRDATLKRLSTTSGQTWF